MLPGRVFEPVFHSKINEKTASKTLPGKSGQLSVKRLGALGHQKFRAFGFQKF
jgi:hypothetical protein